MMWRLVPLLAFVGLVVNASPVELSHLFSSSVNPCDNFHEFVCNKEGNHGLSPLVKELIEGYSTKIDELFAAEKDPIFEEFKKVYLLTFHDISNDNIISLPRNKMYTYLLSMKFIAENNLNPQEWRDEHKPLFDEVKTAIVGAVQPKPTKGYFKQHTMKRLLKIQRCRPNSIMKGKTDLEKEYSFQFSLAPLEVDLFQFLFRAFPLGDSIRPYVGETDNPFSGTLLPGALYKPRSPLGAMLKKLFNRYDMTQFLYEWIYLNQDEINSCTSVYQDGTAEIKAFRLMAKSLSKNGQKIGRFTELQWFFIAHRMHSCRYDEIVKTDELAELRTNPDFRKAFGCKSH
ncbi:hypothetical protein QR680_014544 [Steinernema hermaphroditum]|uniref:Peptidase M13 N-terminal domain-containing protein n=1 Tax=Steinernema hermaphroditum TaxID=289476 RepID=A0AA39I981_9BILA|nr:hypothetical protein QR680_014544 [Steinernema hermaphroditum]